MSAIWGAISLTDNSDAEAMAAQMSQVYQRYKIDRTVEIQGKGASFGCGIQYFTRESIYEQLPKKEGRIYFTADVILDNREELLEILGEKQDSANIPDGDILFAMYDKYKEKCLNQLLGAYAFVYYEEERKEIHIVSDATGKRCLYYSYQDGLFAFSTSLDALAKIRQRKVNERWLVDFMALDNLAVMTEYEETMYQGIYKVEPARWIKITPDGIEKIRYWNPQPKELKLKNDEAYRKAFIQVFWEAVRCVIRSEETAMLLSGGLDSSSVACFAARELRKKGKKLYTFTSVPEKGYLSDMNSYNVTDESEKVKKTADYLGNLECSFVDLSDTNAWEGHYKELEGVEVPYKSAQNALWIEKSMELAREKEARIVLEGGYGNVTISYGSIAVYLNTLLSQKKFLTYIREYYCFAKKYRWGKGKTVKTMIATVVEFFGKEKKSADTTTEDIARSYVKKEKLAQYQVAERLQELNKHCSYEKMEIQKAREMMIGDLQFSQKGEMTTKHSLITGVITRDPCMDKRLIEFCMSLPANQFCCHGISRRLVREYLEGIVPDHIIKVQDYGYQSADMMKKVSKNWDSIYQEMREIYERNCESDMVDTHRALEDLDNLGQELHRKRYFDFIRLVYTAMVLEKTEKRKE